MEEEPESGSRGPEEAESRKAGWVGPGPGNMEAGRLESKLDLVGETWVMEVEVQWRLE